MVYFFLNKKQSVNFINIYSNASVRVGYTTQFIVKYSCEVLNRLLNFNIAYFCDSFLIKTSSYRSKSIFTFSPLDFIVSLLHNQFTYKDLIVARWVRLLCDNENILTKQCLVLFLSNGLFR